MENFGCVKPAQFNLMMLEGKKIFRNIPLSYGMTLPVKLLMFFGFHDLLDTIKKLQDATCVTAIDLLKQLFLLSSKASILVAPWCILLYPVHNCGIYELTECSDIKATSSTKSRASVTPEFLARYWGTIIAAVTSTLSKTSPCGIRKLTGYIPRRFLTRQKQLENYYLNTKMYKDAIFKQNIWARGNNLFSIVRKF